jgi:hypothetical protein
LRERGGQARHFAPLATNPHAYCDNAGSRLKIWRPKGSILASTSTLIANNISVFDEVEAPLDHADVESLAVLVHAMTENPRFVMITRNRGTMQRSDLLCSVTREEPGVSKAVSVRIED